MSLDMLQNERQFAVQQVVEWGEALTGFEQCNKYEVRTAMGQTVLRAAETPGGAKSTLLRLWLKAKRPFEMVVMTPMGEAQLQLTRPFRFIFDRLEIADGTGRKLGAVQKKWSWVRRIYEIEDRRDEVIARLEGPLLKPWTFFVKVNDKEVGAIRKKWSGFGKEAFTDADNFMVELDPTVDAALRTLVVGAVFLIDFVHFENKNNN